jgi:hypothetical protein
MRPNAPLDARGKQMTIIALPPDVTPTIVCPDWCTIPTDEHLADLPNWEGSVIHHSATVKVDRFHVSCSRLAYPDGTPQPDPHGPADVVIIDDDALDLDVAEAFARAILAAVSEARS